jgi:hypothetical protein
MPLNYCERWNAKAKGPVKPLSQAEAERRHETGKPYTALVGPGESGTRVVVAVRLETGYVGVTFLDADQQPELLYVFGFAVGDDADGTTMYLTEARYRDTTGAEPETIYKFERDGSMVARRGTPDDGFETLETTIDPATLAEPVPGFGSYSSVTRRERDRPVADQAA